MKLTTEQKEYIKSHLKSLKELHSENYEFFKEIADSNFGIRSTQVIALLAYEALNSEHHARNQ